MPTVTIKLNAAEHVRLQAEAVRRRTTKSALLRSAWASVSAPNPPAGSLWARIGHLAGSIDGPGNLSALSKTLPGYGRSRTR